jgi:hypothetical protein
MAAVFAQMHGDPVRTRRNRGLRGTRGIGMPPAARVPERRDVIDIHAKPDRAQLSH